MKKIIIVFLSAFFLCSCSEEKTEDTVTLKSDIPPHTLVIKAVEFKKTDSTNTLLLETTLWNNTKDTLKYVSMSCSWHEVYQFSNHKVFIPETECDKNSPIIISVEPGTNAKTFFKVNLDGTSEGSKEKVKLGIKLIAPKGTPFYKDFTEHSQDSSGLIWSNEITL